MAVIMIFGKRLLSIVSLFLLQPVMFAQLQQSVVPSQIQDEYISLSVFAEYNSAIINKKLSGAGLPSTVSTQTLTICLGQCFSVSAAPVGGTPPYTYIWNTGNTGVGPHVFCPVVNSFYTYTVTDATGNSNFTVNDLYVIVNPVITSVNVSGNNVSCNGGSNGQISLSPVGGTPAYTYSWIPGNATTNSISGLSAGTYTFIIADANGCAVAAAVNVTQPPVLILNSGGQTNILCNGGSTGSATANATGGAGGYIYSWSNGATGATAGNLAATVYSATVTDANGCKAPQTFTITQPGVLSLNSAGQTNVLCNGAGTGSATVSGSGGVGGYSYNWSNGVTGAIANNLSATVYTATVTDANGCTATRTFTITEPGALSLNVNGQTNVLCNGAATGSATVTASGGAGGYSYSWSNGATGATAANLSATIYTATVTDANGCKATQSITITQPPALTLSTTGQNNLLCNGVSIGSATVNASGGTGGYNYTWSSGASGVTASNLSATIYTASVTDGSGCTATRNVTITQPAVLVLNLTGQTNVLCNGGSIGTATMNASGGTAAYTYMWSTGATGVTATGLGVAIYSATVSDANGCTATQNVSITQPNSINLVMGSTNATCGSANGSVSVNASGGAGGFTYLWNPGGVTTSAVSSLAPGVFSATVTDANGCISTNTVAVASAGSPTLIVTSQNDVSCNGGNNGSVTVSASGGSGAYTYLWSNANTSSSLSNLTQGIYSATVTDANGCPSSLTVTVTQPPALAVNIASQNDVLCNGINTGSVTVNAAGGSGGYLYNWSNAATTPAINALAAGVYTLTVTDSQSCISTLTVTITEPSALTSTVTAQTNVLCNGGNNGSITVSGSGGAGGYIYNWSNAATTSAIGNLPAAVYSLTIADANGCITTETITITEPPALQVSVSASATVCPGQNTNLTASASGGSGTYTYSWDPGAFSGVSYIVSPSVTTTYSMIASDGNGCTSGPHIITLTLPLPLALNISQPTEICAGANTTLTALANGGSGGYNYLWQPGAATTTSVQVTPAASTTYSCAVTDNCLEIAVAIVTVSVNPLPVVSFTCDITQGCKPVCVNFVNNTPNSFSVNWMFGDGNTSANANPNNCFTNEGLYSVTLAVTDNKGCSNVSSITNMITVHPNPVAGFVVNKNETSVLDPLIEFTDNSTGSTSWLWRFGDGSPVSTNQNPGYAYVNTGTFTVKQIVTNEYGCIDSTEQTIKVNPDYAFYIPNAVTPNDDGLNEEFKPIGMGMESTDYEFCIYDRWGNLIFKTTNFNKGWNARSEVKNEWVLEDVYVWTINTRDIFNKTYRYNGTVTVVR